MNSNSFSLNEIEELQEATGSNDTPTGALRRLEGRRNETTTPAQMSSGATEPKTVNSTQLPRSTTETPQLGLLPPLPGQSGCLLEAENIEKLLLQLTSILQSVSALRIPTTRLEMSLEVELSAMQNTLVETERRSELREARLQNLVSAVSFPLFGVS